MTTDNSEPKRPNRPLPSRFTDPIDAVPIVDGQHYVPPGTPNRERILATVHAWSRYRATGDSSGLVELGLFPEK